MKNKIYSDIEKEKRKVENMANAIEKVIEILQPAASNRRIMQIAGPARQAINILKPFRK